ncbi:glycosyltransferase family 39 protein [Streptacidiphilus sp. N1-10]|uniref:Glycosyltransferase family 39 protein n=1 Tax=Streptacidiphilus jeojiensis TaxID=3229225 RepID=A0ABV6XPL6_9ACTN
MAAVQLPRIAWRQVLPVLAVLAALLEATAGRYGYHRDELYFMVAGHHPAWGYADQPPLVPLLVRLDTAVLGDSVRALRTLPLLVALCTVFLAALCARELAGPDARRSRRSQLLAAVATALSALVLVSGHLFVTSGVDLCVWALLLWLVLRWLRTRDDRLWLLAGVAAGVGLLVNNLVALLALALVLSAAAVGPRTLFRSPLLYAGAVIALLVWTPDLIWQWRHGWPQLTMARQISSNSQRVQLLPFQFEASFPLLWIAGWWALARRREFDGYRLLAVGYPVTLALVLVTGGKPYYATGWAPLLLAAGSVAAVDWLWRPDRARTARHTGTVLLAAVLGVVFSLVEVVAALPVVPVSTYHLVQPLNAENGETVGWPELTATVAGVYRALPSAADRSGATLIAENYGEAGALDHYGRPLGLPTPYADHDGYADFGTPSGDGPSIMVGFEPEQLTGYWGSCTLAARIDNGRGLDNQEQHKQVLVCRDRLLPWPDLWKRLRHYS